MHYDIHHYLKHENYFRDHKHKNKHRCSTDVIKFPLHNL